MVTSNFCHENPYPSLFHLWIRISYVFFSLLSIHLLICNLKFLDFMYSLIKKLPSYLLARYLNPCHRKRILIPRNQANNLRNTRVGKAPEWCHPLCCVRVVFRVTATSCSPFENSFLELFIYLSYSFLFFHWLLI